jgi:integrase/recombinase XerD
VETGQNRPQTLMNTGFGKSGGTGTGKHDGEKVAPTWAELMTAWQQWLALQNYAAGAQKDFPQKVQLLRLFLAQRGLIDGAERADLGAIDAATLGDYQAFVFDYVSPKTGRKLKTMSQIHALSYVQSFFRFLKKTKRIALDPARVIRLPRAPQTLPAALLTPDEMRRLLAVPDVHTPTGFRDRCILEVFWTTGIRIGELLSLAVRDIDFAQALCTIRHGKGGKPRVVPLGAGALAWLREYIDGVRPLLASEAKGDAPQTLFLSRFGVRMDKSGLHYKLKAYQRRAGIKKNLTAHSFRHTLASEMLRAGADLRHIQELLGHGNLTTTQRYLHVVKADLKKVHGRTHPREAHAPTTSTDYHGERS